MIKIYQSDISCIC